MEPYAGCQLSQSQYGKAKGTPSDSKPKLLDQARAILRLHHYSIHTERSYLEWIRRYVRFHGIKSRGDLADGERKIESFLTALTCAAPVMLRM
jgi:hypothetical protein